MNTATRVALGATMLSAAWVAAIAHNYWPTEARIQRLERLMSETPQSVEDHITEYRALHRIELAGLGAILNLGGVKAAVSETHGVTSTLVVPRAKGGYVLVTGPRGNNELSGSHCWSLDIYPQDADESSESHDFSLTTNLILLAAAILAFVE